MSNIFLLYVKPHFYFDRLPWSLCIQYDMMLVFSNETVNSHEVTVTHCELMCSCRHVVRCRGWESPVHACFSICGVNKTVSLPFIKLFAIFCLFAFKYSPTLIHIAIPIKWPTFFYSSKNEFLGIPRYSINSVFMNGLRHPVRVFA